MGRGRRKYEGGLHCSFCGKSQHEVRKLIAGPSAFVCDECIELCNNIIRTESVGEEVEKENPKSGLPTPSKIGSIIDEYFIEQTSNTPARP